MIKKCMKWIVDILLGIKPYPITREKIAEYERVGRELNGLCGNIVRNDNSNIVCLVGEKAKLVSKELLPWFRWVDQNVKEENIIVPPFAANYFLNGGSWNEIMNYDAVVQYGMLHGKRRYLQIV